MALESNNGLYRANPSANPDNNLRLVHPTSPGTAAQDNLDAANLTNKIVAGVKYTGADGVNTTYYFETYNIKGNPMRYTATITASDAKLVEAAVTKLLSRFEVDPVFTITIQGGNDYDTRHVGAGTLTNLVYSDGTTSSAFTRTAL